jgi:hypothetical protein
VSTTSVDRRERAGEDSLGLPEAEIMEVLLLLPGRVAAEGERLAFSRGLTLGQLLRLLLRDFLASPRDLSTPSPVAVRRPQVRKTGPE